MDNLEKVITDKIKKIESEKNNEIKMFENKMYAEIVEFKKCKENEIAEFKRCKENEIAEIKESEQKILDNWIKHLRRELRYTFLRKYFQLINIKNDEVNVTSIKKNNTNEFLFRLKNADSEYYIGIKLLYSKNDNKYEGYSHRINKSNNTNDSIDIKYDSGNLEITYRDSKNIYISNIISYYKNQNVPDQLAEICRYIAAYRNKLSTTNYLFYLPQARTFLLANKHSRSFPRDISSIIYNLILLK
jgi:hypothetical protein